MRQVGTPQLTRVAQCLLVSSFVYIAVSIEMIFHVPPESHLCNIPKLQVCSLTCNILLTFTAKLLKDVFLVKMLHTLS